MKAYIRGIGNISPQDSWENTALPEEMIVHEGNRLCCIEPDYKEFIKPIQMRRMSRSLKMGVAAAGKCLRDAGVEVPDAIVIGTGLGMMGDTEKFLLSILDNDEKFLTPTSFIQSTHNTVGAHIAVMLKCNKYNFTYVNENLSFEGALLDSLLRLMENPSDNILLAGIDELTYGYFAITKNAGFWKEGIENNTALLAHESAGSIAGEGASFFIVSTAEHPNNYAVIRGVDTFYKPESDEELSEFILDFLSSRNMEMKDVDLLLTGMNGEAEGDDVYKRMRKSTLTGMPQAYYKHLCGEYYTSSAFAIRLGAIMLKTQQCPQYIMLNGHQPPKKLKNILFYNQNNNTKHSLILLSAC